MGVCRSGLGASGARNEQKWFLEGGLDCFRNLKGARLVRGAAAPWFLRCPGVGVCHDRLDEGQLCSAVGQERGKGQRPRGLRKGKWKEVSEKVLLEMQSDAGGD